MQKNIKTFINSVDHLEKNKIFNIKIGKVIKIKRSILKSYSNQNRSENPIGDKLIRQLELNKNKNKNYF